MSKAIYAIIAAGIAGYIQDFGPVLTAITALAILGGIVGIERLVEHQVRKDCGC